MLFDQHGHAIMPREASKIQRPTSMNDVFDGARRNNYRGMFYFPTLDHTEQMPEMTRDEISRKINWLYNNVPAVAAVVNGLAIDDVGTGLWPKPATESTAFNFAVRDLWNQQCGFHKSFSADGENNFYSAQLAVRRDIYMRGDCFGLKLRAGEAAACPQLHLIPGWQVGNAVNSRIEQERWVEGRQNNKFGRALKFRVRTSRDFRNFQDVDSSDIIHFHDPFLIGQTRGMSILAPAVRHLFSLDDIERAETPAVLMRSRVAYAIERMEGDEDGPVLLPGAREVKKYTDDTGVTLLVQRIETGDGGEVEIADLTGGKKIKVVESQKSSEAESWITHLLNQVAAATLRHPSYVLNLAGLTNGTLIRMVQQRIQLVVNTIRDFQIILQMLEEWWPFWLWQNIAAGKFDGVRGGIPDRWWEYQVVRPRDLSVDRQDGKLYDDRVASGRMPSGLYVGMLYGEDHETFEDEIIRDQYRRRKRNREIAQELGEDEIPVEQIFRPPAGSTMPPIEIQPPAE